MLHTSLTNVGFCLWNTHVYCRTQQSVIIPNVFNGGVNYDAAAVFICDNSMFYSLQ